MRTHTLAIIAVAIGYVLHSSGVAQQPSADKSSATPFMLEGAKAYPFKSVGEHTLQLHAFFPEGWQASDSRPAIVFFFGGGWVGGTPAQFAAACQHLASRGMVAISAEYRVESRHGTSPADCVADGKSAIRWVRQHARELGVDSARIAAGGGSAGGHVAISTATLETLPEEQPSTLSCVPNAVVLFNPVCDTTQLGYGHDRLAGRARELSPIHHIRSGMPPTLILHGDADRVVPLENVLRFQRLMQEAGNGCDVVTYRDAKHGFFNPGRPNNAYEATLQRVDQFLTSLGYLSPDDDARVAGRTFTQWQARLQEHDATDRLLAAHTIGMFGSVADDVLIQLLDDADAAVRYVAAISIGDRRSPANASAEAHSLMNGTSRACRMAAAYALCRLGDIEIGLPVLQQMLSVPERSTACTAADLLGRIGPAASPALDLMVAEMARQADRDNYHVRDAIKNALRHIRLDTSLEAHTRPMGGGIPGGWQPSTAAVKHIGQSGQKRPNILWISCEDISPNLGCYGDAYARTPNLDRLAREGARFDRAFTPAGVCAVVRSGLITGVYAVSQGSQHMRSQIIPPQGVRCFTEYLRESGYFCTNKSKTDYQFDPPKTAWDRQGTDHHDWRDREPGQPFFSVINLTITHESQIRHGERTHAALLDRLSIEQHHDAKQAGAYLPPIYPNTPEARKDWAWYADNISEMDRQAGLILDQLAADGLADDTIVVFWGDHGRGLPRSKRWIYDSGVRIPLIVRWPGHVQPDTVREDLVSTQDFAPTMLSIAGAAPKPHMQGRVFLGGDVQAEPAYLFFHRDRMDEAYELMRAARDHRYKYIRNYQPSRPYAQHIDYMDRMPTLVDMRAMYATGELSHVQSRFFQQGKPIEELYDLQLDPHETVNLAWLPEHAERVASMRSALEEWQRHVHDLGLVPEPVMMEAMRPNDIVQTVPEPEVLLLQDGQRNSLTLRVEAPGASLTYRVKTHGDSIGEWRLYSGPVELPVGSVVEAMACQAGYLDSPVVHASSEAVN